MTYATLMVHLDARHANAPLLDVTADLAKRFAAQVIGIAAAQPAQIGTADGFYSGDCALVEREIVDDELARAKAEFDACAALAPFVLEWRSIPALEPIAQVIAAEARSVDLVITGIGHGATNDANTHADTGDLILCAGRPVLVIPPTSTASLMATAMIAWNDTRECRRAILDALPLLKQADRVVVVAVADDTADAHVEVRQVIGWLARHAVNAERHVTTSRGGVARRLADIANDQAADLIVAGAYGHNRLREWAFGGVTRDMLLGDGRCALLSN